LCFQAAHSVEREVFCFRIYSLINPGCILLVVQIVSDVERALLSKLSDCKSSSDCQLAVVRSLGNARLPGSVEALIDLSVNSSHAAVSEAALMALTRFDHDLILHSTLVCALYIISASAS